MKHIKYLILIALLSLVLSSCGLIIEENVEINDIGQVNLIETDNSDTTKRNISQNSDIYTEIINSSLRELPFHDYNGESVLLYTSSEEMTGCGDLDNLFSRLIYTRNASVENYLNIQLIPEYYSSDDLPEQVKRDALSGTEYADLIFTNQGNIGLLDKNNLLLDLSTRPEYKEYNELTSEKSAYTSSLGKEIFGVSGADSMNPNIYYAIYFKPDLFDEKGIDINLIYDEVKNHNWSWDSYCKYAAFLDTPSIVTPLDQKTILDTVFKSLGFSYLKKGEKAPVIDFSSDDLKSVYNTYASLINNGLKTSSYSSSDDFATGHSFMINKLTAIEKLSDNKIRFGILPIPGEDSFSYCAHNQFMFSIPSKNKNSNIAYSVILSFNAVSKVVYEKYYKDLLFTSCDISDNDVAMIPYITDGGEFDILYTYQKAYPDFDASTKSFIYSNMNTTEETLKKSIAKINEKIEKIVNPPKKETKKIKK